MENLDLNYDPRIIADLISVLAIHPKYWLLWDRGPDERTDERTGRILRPWATAHWAHLCGLIESCPEGRQRCLASDRKLAAACSQTLKPHLHRCHAGLVDAAVPIVAGGKCVVVLFCGQVVPGPLTEKVKSKLMSKVQDLPLDAAELKRAISEVRTMPLDILRHGVDLMWKGTQLAVAQAAHREAVAERLSGFVPSPWPEAYVAIAQEYVRANLHRPLRLATVCKKVVHLDRSYFGRIFRRLTGMTFGQYVLQQKIEHAMRLLAANRDLSVNGIASAVGFDDPSYFGRVFKRLVGRSPSAFRTKSISSEANKSI